MKNNKELTSMLYQKRILGILCILLAPLCLGFGLFGLKTNLPGWYLSISATYYANSKMFMIGLLFAISVFLFSYQCYDWRDRVITLIEAVSAVGIVVFPCKTPGIPETVGIFNINNSISHIIHCIFAAILFLSFAIQITFLFTITKHEMTEKKRRRNMIYRICGIVIFVFLAWQVITSAFKFIPSYVPMTWINEFFMLIAYGFAYLVKSEAIARLNDIK